MTAVLYELMLKLEKLRSHPPPMSLVEDVEICVLYTEQENYTVSKQNILGIQRALLFGWWVWVW